MTRAIPPSRGRTTSTIVRPRSQQTTSAQPSYASPDYSQVTGHKPSSPSLLSKKGYSIEYYPGTRKVKTLKAPSIEYDANLSNRGIVTKDTFIPHEVQFDKQGRIIKEIERETYNSWTSSGNKEAWSNTPYDKTIRYYDSGVPTKTTQYTTYTHKTGRKEGVRLDKETDWSSGDINIGRLKGVEGREASGYYNEQQRYFTPTYRTSEGEVKKTIMPKGGIILPGSVYSARAQKGKTDEALILSGKTAGELIKDTRKKETPFWETLGRDAVVGRQEISIRSPSSFKTQSDVDKTKTFTERLAPDIWTDETVTSKISQPENIYGGQRVEPTRDAGPAVPIRSVDADVKNLATKIFEYNIRVSKYGETPLFQRDQKTEKKLKTEREQLSVLANKKYGYVPTGEIIVDIPKYGASINIPSLANIETTIVKSLETTSLKSTEDKTGIYTGKRESVLLSEPKKDSTTDYMPDYSKIKPDIDLTPKFLNDPVLVSGATKKVQRGYKQESEKLIDSLDTTRNKLDSLLGTLSTKTTEYDKTTSKYETAKEDFNKLETAFVKKKTEYIKTADKYKADPESVPYADVARLYAEHMALYNIKEDKYKEANKLYKTLESRESEGKKAEQEFMKYKQEYTTKQDALENFNFKYKNTLRDLRQTDKLKLIEDYYIGRQEKYNKQMEDITGKKTPWYTRAADFVELMPIGTAKTLRGIGQFAVGAPLREYKEDIKDVGLAKTTQRGSLPGYYTAKGIYDWDEKDKDLRFDTRAAWGAVDTAIIGASAWGAASKPIIGAGKTALVAPPIKSKLASIGLKTLVGGAGATAIYGPTVYAYQTGKRFDIGKGISGQGFGGAEVTRERALGESAITTGRIATVAGLSSTAASSVTATRLSNLKQAMPSGNVGQIVSTEGKLHIYKDGVKGQLISKTSKTRQPFMFEGKKYYVQTTPTTAKTRIGTIGIGGKGGISATSTQSTETVKGAQTQIFSDKGVPLTKPQSAPVIYQTTDGLIYNSGLKRNVGHSVYWNPAKNRYEKIQQTIFSYTGKVKPRNEADILKLYNKIKQTPEGKGIESLADFKKILRGQEVVQSSSAPTKISEKQFDVFLKIIKDKSKGIVSTKDVNTILAKYKKAATSGKYGVSSVSRAQPGTVTLFQDKGTVRYQGQNIGYQKALPDSAKVFSRDVGIRPQSSVIKDTVYKPTSFTDKISNFLKDFKGKKAEYRYIPTKKETTNALGIRYFHDRKTYIPSNIKLSKKDLKNIGRANLGGPEVGRRATGGLGDFGNFDSRFGFKPQVGPKRSELFSYADDVIKPATGPSPSMVKLIEQSSIVPQVSFGQGYDFSSLAPKTESSQVIVPMLFGGKSDSMFESNILGSAEYQSETLPGFESKAASVGESTSVAAPTEQAMSQGQSNTDYGSTNIVGTDYFGDTGATSSPATEPSTEIPPGYIGGGTPMAPIGGKGGFWVPPMFVPTGKLKGKRYAQTPRRPLKEWTYKFPLKNLPASFFGKLPPSSKQRAQGALDRMFGKAKDLDNNRVNRIMGRGKTSLKKGMI